jgi:hypothetical protein
MNSPTQGGFMNYRRVFSSWLLAFTLTGSLATAQAVPQVQAVVPRLVNFSGHVTTSREKPSVGVIGITFTIYREQYEGTPLWIETQNITVDAKANYTAQLGATKSDGLPMGLFSTGDARWLGVRLNGGEEQPRVLLLSVPYALKAADAETIGGLPPSAFVLATPGNIASARGNSNPALSTTALTPASTDVTTSGGTANTLPLFTTATNVQSSGITQTGSGATAKIGINTTTPAATLDVKGAATVRGTVALPPLAPAKATAGSTSQALNLIASSFSATTNAPVNQVFEWKAEPTANDTASPSGTLNLLYGSGTAAPTETGLKINNKGVLSFSAAQTFPGIGLVTSVGLTAPASDFTVTGSPVTGNGTMAIAWAPVAPTPENLANAIVKRDASGNFSAATISAEQVNAFVFGGIDAESNVRTPVTAVSTASGTGATGVWASVTSDVGWGVYGSASSQTGNPRGVFGSVTGASGIGVFGQAAGVQSGISNEVRNVGAGLWGDGGAADFISGDVGVFGTGDDGIAGYFINNSATGFTTLVAEAHNAGSALFYAHNIGRQAFCEIDAGANLSCTGSKNAIVPIDGGKRIVAMSAVESPQNWFEDFGAGDLVNGVALIVLDPDFIQTVNSETDYKVFPVPNEDCKGLYITRKRATSFEVRELGGGTSSVHFDYRITALRKNFENVRFADHTHDMDSMKLIEEKEKLGAQQLHSSDLDKPYQSRLAMRNNGRTGKGSR